MYYYLFINIYYSLALHYRITFIPYKKRSWIFRAGSIKTIPTLFFLVASDLLKTIIMINHKSI